MSTEIELLRRFADEKSEAAFAELVRHRIDFVFGVALRQVGDPHLAEEVAQTVFLDLARKAAAISRRPFLVSWLYTSTRLAAIQALRGKARWFNRQQEAYKMQESSYAGSPDVNWQELRPVLDEAMHDLNEADRAAVLLRYFEGLPLAEIGRMLGIAENTARMRVDRALEKLRVQLARRGITSTTAALGVAISVQPVTAAPVGLAAAIAGASFATATVGGVGGATIPILMSMTKINLAAIVAIVAVGAGTYVAGQRQLETEQAANRESSARNLREIGGLARENARLKQENRQLNEQLASAARAASPGLPESGVGAPAQGTGELATLQMFSDMIKDGTLRDQLARDHNTLARLTGQLELDWSNQIENGYIHAVFGGRSVPPTELTTVPMSQWAHLSFLQGVIDCRG